MNTVKEDPYKDEVPDNDKVFNLLLFKKKEKKRKKLSQLYARGPVVSVNLNISNLHIFKELN